jgi:anaerobic selenocysteine-containing dehydrogenase
MSQPSVNTQIKTWDEIKTTTCYMCACRCGIKVYLKDGTVKYIEGNKRSSRQQGRDLRQGCLWHHAALPHRHASPSR